MLNLNRLRLLVELERLGTIAAVAEALAYTPSAVSQQLTALERETGVVLLEKVGRGVRLTGAAQGLAAHGRAAIAVLEEAEAELAGTRSDVRGVLRVASFQTVVVTLAPTALARLADEHPALDVRITHAEMDAAYRGLRARAFDVILGEEFPDRPEPTLADVDRIDLLRDPLYLVLPQQGPWSTPGSLSDLSDAPWALDPIGSTMGDWTRRVCASAGFVPRVAFDTPDPLLHTHLIRSGLAVGFIPALIAAEHLDGTTVRRLPGAPQRVLYTAVRRASATHPSVRAFRDALASAADLVAPEAPDEASNLRLR